MSGKSSISGIGDCQSPGVLVRVDGGEPETILVGDQPMRTTASLGSEDLDLNGLGLPKPAYDHCKLSPVAGDTAPLDVVVVHPESELLQASPAVGFVESEGPSVKNSSTLSVKVNSKRSSSNAKQRGNKIKVSKVATRSPTSQQLLSSFSSTGSSSSSDRMSVSNHPTEKTSYQPLSIAEARKGGNGISASTTWNFDGESILKSFFPDRELTVFVGTWNMGEMKDLPTSLDDFILPLTHNAVADVVVVGLQECSCEFKKWDILVQQTLGPSHVLVQSVPFGALHLAVFVRRELLWHCSSVNRACFTTKPGSIARTKGGIGVCLSLFGSSFLFINSHLTAYEEKVAERNADFAKIVSNLSLSANGSEDERDLCNRFDYVFWCGDLNYRIDMTRPVVEGLLKKSDYMELLFQDQLTKEILKGNIFQGFSEQPIDFSPTYKYDFFSDNYDTSEKQRVPSWTDRILFKSGNGSEGGLVGIGYHACPTILDSDHRPVYGMFKALLNPPAVLDGIPDAVASFDLDVYNQANTLRKKMASLTRGKSHSSQTSSAVCSIF